MSSIVYQPDRRSGSTYAYRSEPTRDPKTGKPSQKRTYLGRVDPRTGEIVPKAAPGKRNRSRLDEGLNHDGTVAGNPSASLISSQALRDENDRLRAEITRLTRRVAELEETLSRIMAATSTIVAECHKVLEVES